MRRSDTVNHMKMRKLKNFIAAAGLACALMLPAGVYAAPEDETETQASTETSETQGSTEANPGDYIDYTGQVDIFTGLPVSESADGESNVVAITDSCSYDRNTGLYAYQIGEATIRCSVADGMVTTSPVTLTMEGKANLAVYRDGESMSEIPSSLDAFGAYSLVTWTDSTESQIMTFQIVNKTTGKLQNYVMPDGFRVDKVYMNGEQISHSQGSVDLTKEGDYTIEYSCAANGLAYVLEIKVDHTPPQVTFQGVDEDNEARGPVTLAGVEPTDIVTVTFNEEETRTMNYSTEMQVTETGHYVVRVSDEAGNVVEKEFRIQIYLNLNAALFLVAILLLIVGVAVALMVSKKKLRVR